jgi:2-(1,2-epoxy-1,2-dihydrophenyl)acetyl-CoA isomerase
VREYIEKYSNGPTAAYAAIKKMINQAQFSDFSLMTQMEVEMQTHCEATADHKEAVYAFLEKRPPKFIGK